MDHLLDAIANSLSGLDARDAALVVWGLSATMLNLTLIRALAEANRRFNTFVAELARFNARFEPGHPSPPQA
jgi:hypothetical protein